MSYLYEQQREWEAWYKETAAKVREHNERIDRDIEARRKASEGDCPICGDRHEPSAMPFTCETGDGA